MAVRRGFEPPRTCALHAFQSCAFDHSATSPAWRMIAKTTQNIKHVILFHIMVVKQMVDTFIIRDGHVLLGRKNRGIGQGFWNGFGGKVMPSESVEEAARREVREECGLTGTNLEPCARLLFSGEIPEIIEAHMFLVRAFDGKIVPSEEMDPIAWHSLSAVPYGEMWPDFRLWFSHVALGGFACGHGHYKGHALIFHNIRACDSLPPIETLLPEAALYADVEALV